MDKIKIRAYIDTRIQDLIEESIYYRANNENMNQDKRLIAWVVDQENGKIQIP